MTSTTPATSLGTSRRLVRPGETVTDATSWVLRFLMPAEHRHRPDEYMELIGVTVQDGDGATGTGFTFTVEDGGARAVQALLDDVILPGIVGAAPTEAPRCWEEGRRRTHRLGRGISMMAVAAADIALWDLRARREERPLAATLGAVRDRVPGYGSGRGSAVIPTDQLAAVNAEYADMGLRGVKIRVGVDLHDDLRRVAAVREAIGDSTHLMCDANERLSLPQALWLGQRLGEQDVYWFEEPLPSERIEAHARLRAALPMAISVGEHLFDRWQFQDYLAAGAADIVNPDACMSGGVTEFMRIAELAGSHGVTLSPHFMTPLHIHLAAAAEAADYVEWFPFMDHMLQEPLEVSDGDVLVPDRPGHGIDFQPDAFEHHRVA